MKNLRLSLMLVLSLFIFSSCSSKNKNREKQAVAAAAEKQNDVKDHMTEKKEALKEKMKPHPYEESWSYTGAKGPSNWKNLKTDYALCGNGKMQSPIDLKWSKPQETTRTIELDYKEVPLSIIDNGHTIQVQFPPGSQAYFGGKRYELVQMHFHTSSEHTLSGNQLPLEAQLVHKNELGQLAILGLFLIEGRFNPFIEKIWSHIPTEKHAERLVPNLLINAKDIIPNRLTYYFYIGSLTTPPCTEGVRWHVLNTPVEISRDQIVAFRKLYKNNARPTQPLYKRNILNY